MKNKLRQLLVGGLTVVATMAVSTASTWILYQPKTPSALK